MQISTSGDTPKLAQLESGAVVVTWYDYVDGANATRESSPVFIDVVQSTGTEDQPVTLPFTVSLTDTDGSEVLDLVRIEGLPEGFTLAVGAREGSPTGAWVIDRNAATTDAFLDDLAAGTLGLVATPAAGYNGNFTLTITATSREIANGDTETSAAVLVPVLDRTERSAGGGGRCRHDERGHAAGRHRGERRACERHRCRRGRLA